MLGHLALGSLIITVTIAVQAEAFNLFTRYFENMLLGLRRIFRRFANTAAVIMGVLFILAVMTVNVWIWALTFLSVGA